MLSIGHIYENLDKYAKDNYYAQGTESPVTWGGKGAERLGLKGEVKNEDYQAAREGRHPETGERLVSPASNGKHRDGYDLTFSLPKGISMLREFGPLEVREAIDRGFSAAVGKTMEMVEKKYIQVRETRNGRTELISTGNAVWVQAGHGISRELDMHDHVHYGVMNQSYNSNTDKWQAIESKALYDNKMYIGQYCKNEAAINIKENLAKLGYNIQFETDSKGLYDITIYSREEKDVFSRRSKQINAKMHELKGSGKYEGVNEAKLREIACLDSRAAKRDVDMNAVRENWKERGENLGITEKTTIERLQKATELTKQNEANRTEPKMTEYDIVRQAAKIRTEQESTFSREDILKTAGKLSVGEHRMSDLEKAFKELNGDKEIKRLAENVYTTKEIYKIERDIVQKVQSGYNSVNAISSKEKVEQGIKSFEQARGFTMTADQKDAVGYILTSKDKFVGIQGDAGAGKTTMLAAVKEQAETQGYIVRGMSFTGQATSKLQEVGIKSQTIHSFLGNFDKKQILKGKEVWVVDESSMLGSKQMHEILKLAKKFNARVVLVGDKKQLRAIDAGKMFSELQERGYLKTVRMSEVQRQKEKGYKDIVKDISEKRIDQAFDKLERQGRITEIADKQSRINDIVKDYLSRKNFKDTTIVTERNADRNLMNNRICSGFKEQGKLGKNEYTFTVRESKNLSPESKHFAQSYSISDTIVANKKGIIGKTGPGTEAKIVSVDQQNHKITVQTLTKTYEINLKTQGQHLAVYQEKQQSFSAGEQIAFLKNDKGLKVQNGHLGEIKSIDKKGNVKIKMESGKSKNINLKTQYNYIDKGYAVSVYKSQGGTNKRIIQHADTKAGVNYNQGYVAGTRGEYDLKIYTDDKEKMREQMKIEQAKTSTLGHGKDKEVSKLNKTTLGYGKSKTKPETNCETSRETVGTELGTLKQVSKVSGKVSETQKQKISEHETNRETLKQGNKITEKVRMTERDL